MEGQGRYITAESLDYLQRDLVNIVLRNPDPAKPTSGLVVMGQIYKYVPTLVPFNGDGVACDLLPRRENDKEWPTYVLTRTFGYDIGVPIEMDDTMMEDNTHYDVLLPRQSTGDFITELPHYVDEATSCIVLRSIPRWHILGLIPEDEPLTYMRQVTLPIGKRICIILDDGTFRAGPVVDVYGEDFEPIISADRSGRVEDLSDDLTSVAPMETPDDTEDWRQQQDRYLGLFGSFLEAPNTKATSSIRKIVFDARDAAFDGLVSLRVTGCKPKFETYYGFAANLDRDPHYFDEKSYNADLMPEPFSTFAVAEPGNISVGDVIIGRIIGDARGTSPPIEWFIPTGDFLTYFMYTMTPLKKKRPSPGSEWDLLLKGSKESEIIKMLVDTRFWWL